MKGDYKGFTALVGQAATLRIRVHSCLFVVNFEKTKPISNGTPRHGPDEA
jgi:hypothetical protein